MYKTKHLYYPFFIPGTPNFFLVSEELRLAFLLDLVL